jgi:hypothetical protein
LLPSVKFGLGLRDHPQSHPGVLVAAILGAGAEIGAGRVGLDPEMVRMPRHHVALGAQLWHPEVVDDVATFDAHQ